VIELKAVPRKRVLHVIDSLGFGGAQTILKHYFESRAGDETLHLYGLRTAPNRVEIEHPNVNVELSASRFSIAPLVTLHSIVQERRIDVMHCHLFRAQVFGYLLKVFFFPQIVLIFHEHGRVAGREGESWFEALAFRLFLRSAWRRVERFVCISDHTRTRLLKVIAKADGRAVVVTNPIRAHLDDESREDLGSLRAAFEIPANVFVVGFAARFLERKGWRDFLHAVRIVAAQIPVFFLLAGDGEDRDKVEVCIRDLGLGDRGRMLGHVTRMDRFYRVLDCFVMPPHWEPHGLSHLEAQSYGIPVVVSNVPGLNGTVHAESDALVFEAGDAPALADRILQIASNRQLRTRLIHDGSLNAARYTIDIFARKLDQLYSEVRAWRSGSVDAG
jgi:glycosyltransferase involved in cell wall biosynthesis